MAKELGPRNIIQQVGDVIAPERKVTKRRRRLELKPVTLPDLDNITLLLTEEQQIVLAKLTDAWKQEEDYVDKQVLIQILIDSQTDQPLTPKEAGPRLYLNILKLREKFVAVNANYYIESTTTQLMKQRKESGGYAFRQKLPAVKNSQGTQEQTIFQDGPEPEIVSVETPDQKEPDPFDSNFFNRQRSFAVRGKDFKEIERAPQIRTPEQLLALSSTLKVLSSLLDGKLSQLDPNIKLFLEGVMQGNRHFKGVNSSTLETLFNIPSINRLKRFFKITFIALAEQGYSPIETEKETLEEEKLIRKKCEELKNRSCDIKTIIHQVLPYFDIEIPQEYL